MCNQLPTNPTGPRSIIFVVSNNIEAAVYMHKKNESKWEHLFK